MLWIMHYLEFAIVSAIIFPIVSEAEGAGECKRYLAQKLQCYDCDSRYDTYCADPFNKSMPDELKPRSRTCEGCCVKFLHKFPDAEWVQRSCTENIIINYFMVDHVCMGEGKGHGKMCFCESNLCNDAPSMVQNKPLHRNLNLLLSVLVSLFTILYYSGLGTSRIII